MVFYSESMFEKMLYHVTLFISYFILQLFPFPVCFFTFKRNLSRRVKVMMFAKLFHNIIDAVFKHAASLKTRQKCQFSILNPRLLDWFIHSGLNLARKLVQNCGKRSGTIFCFV